MTTEILHHLNSNFTKFQLCVSSIWWLVQNFTGVPTFYDFYYRNDRALDTTFAEIFGSHQKMNRQTQHNLKWYLFLFPHGKFLMKMLLHLKAVVNQTQLILYQVYGKNSGVA